VIVGSGYTEPALSRLDLAMAAECAKLGREFPGWEVTWTTTWGFRARKGDDEIEACTSPSAIRCLLAVTEHRMAR
jgi:hypothetical protein